MIVRAQNGANGSQKSEQDNAEAQEMDDSQPRPAEAYIPPGKAGPSNGTGTLLSC